MARTLILCIDDEIRDVRKHLDAQKPAPTGEVVSAFQLGRVARDHEIVCVTREGAGEPWRTSKPVKLADHWTVGDDGGEPVVRTLLQSIGSQISPVMMKRSTEGHVRLAYA